MRDTLPGESPAIPCIRRHNKKVGHMVSIVPNLICVLSFLVNFS